MIKHNNIRFFFIGLTKNIIQYFKIFVYLTTSPGSLRDTRY